MWQGGLVFELDFGFYSNGYFKQIFSQFFSQSFGNSLVDMDWTFSTPDIFINSRIDR